MHDLLKEQNKNIRGLTTCFLTQADFLRYIDASWLKRGDNDIEDKHIR